MDSKILQITVGLVVLFLAWQFWKANCKPNLENLDNRPRWPMGGLRDDTGSHNAKDVFGMGFGLDQTRVGTQTVDGVYNVKLGKSQRTVGGKQQTEYGAALGDPQIQNFLDRKDNFANKTPGKPTGLFSKLKAKIQEKNQEMLLKKLQKQQVRLVKSEPVGKVGKSAFLDRPVRPTSDYAMSVTKQGFASKPSTTEDYLASQLR